MPQVNTSWIDEAIGGLPPLVTTTEAVGVLRMSRRNLYRLIETGKLHAVQQGGDRCRYLVPRTSLEKYLRMLDGSL